MCEYCKDIDKPYNQLQPGDVELFVVYKVTGDNSGMYYNVPTEYCPHCGRKLIEEENK